MRSANTLDEILLLPAGLPQLSHSSLLAISAFKTIARPVDITSEPLQFKFMSSNPAARVVMIVLDAFGPEFVSPDRTPAIMRLAESGAIAPAGGLADMVASTGPGHATFLTGVPSTVHGVLANRLFDARFMPTEDVVVRVPTIIRRTKKAGRSTAIAVSDPDILNTVQGKDADHCWPSEATVAGLADAKTGYMPDHLTVNIVLKAIQDGYDLIVAQLQQTDTAAHASGIDSQLARDSHRAADEAVGEIAEALGRDWERSLLVVVSDHRAENVVQSEPVRLAAALEGIASVIEDGSAALVRPTGHDLGALLAHARTCWGVAAITPLDDQHFVAWSEPGLVFGRERPITTQACHGNGTTRPSLALIAGGHPLVAEVGACMRRIPPPLKMWATVAARALEVEAPPGRVQ